MKKVKRDVDLLVLSDIHLGTIGCQADDLLKYLNSINPKTIILNGDIIDIWQFNKRYWPKSHMRIIKWFSNALSKGSKIYYITGNHDEMLRRFAGFKLGDFRIVNKLILDINGSKAWFFHGDVFDVTMKYAKWLTKLGSIGYDVLILINSMINYVAKLMGKPKVSLSKKIKDSVKSAVKYINDFEKIVSDVAIENNYDFVVCGHIHQPTNKLITNENGQTRYLNSGDWIENLSALEYHNQEWNVFYYKENSLDDVDIDDYKLNNYKDIFNQMASEIQINEEEICI